jgi:hypothetical protein
LATTSTPSSCDARSPASSPGNRGFITNLDDYAVELMAADLTQLIATVAADGPFDGGLIAAVGVSQR